jgi:hypothetical protein
VLVLKALDQDAQVVGGGDKLWLVICEAFEIREIELKTFDDAAETDARNRALHRAVALLLAGGVVADLARHALAVGVLAPARALGNTPFTGAARVAFHLEQTLFLAWPAGLAAIGLVVLAGRRPWPAVAGHALATVGLALTYPAFRGPALASVYLSLELVALGAFAAAALAWWGRRERPSLTEGSVLLLGFVELGAVVAYRQPFGAGWEWAQVIYLVAFSTLIGLHLGELWTSSRPHTSP